MWSFWSRDPTKDFAYEVGELVCNADEKFIWALHRGKRRSTGEAVTVFRYEVKPTGESHIEKAKNALKKLKTLRHPSVLTYLDSLDTDRLILIVTEYVEPLEKYLLDISKYTQQQRQFAISWGLIQVAKGLSFLINDCNLSHNNMCMSSVFVNQSGSWRIGGLEYVTSGGDEYPPCKVLSVQHKYTPAERSDPSKRISGPKWGADSWGLGCLVWEVFNGSLPDANKLKALGKIPKSLSSQYTELISNNANNRLSPSDFITKCRLQNGFLKNNFIDSMLFLEEIQIKDPAEKNRFFTNLDNHLESFPSDICKNKILPQLVTAFEFSNAGSAILGPLFKIGKSLDETEYQKKIVPCVVKLFACKDRATRAKLLQQMELFINYIQTPVVNEQVFPHVAQGFLDSNPLIREQTVKCMLYLAPKLNYQNLNDEVIKQFTRIQLRDPEGGIRTNTAVCLGKIANHLSPQVRQTHLITAFLRSMRDSFPPARIAGILALVATQNFYSLKDCATRVMPALCHLTFDTEKQVRDQAFKALKGFVGKMEKVSEDQTLIEQMEADLNAAGSSVSSTFTSGWAGWAVSSLASKFYRSKPTSATSATSPSKDNEDGKDKDRVHTSGKGDDRDRTSTPSITNSESKESIVDDDGFDDDLGSMDVVGAASGAERKKSLDGWDADEWGDQELDQNEVMNANDDNEMQHDLLNSSNPTSPVKVEADEFFSQFESGKSGRSGRNVSSQNRKRQTTNIAKSNEFNQENVSERLADISLSEEMKKRSEAGTATDVQQERSRRGNESQMERRKKGPMKLGAQKIT